MMDDRWAGRAGSATLLPAQLYLTVEQDSTTDAIFHRFGRNWQGPKSRFALP